MAVFGPVPGFARASILVRGSDDLSKARQAAALLSRASAAAADRDPMIWTGLWPAAYEAVGLPASTTPPTVALAVWAARSGGVPSQGVPADVVNAFSLLHAVPTAVYNVSDLNGDLTLAPSRGVETFEPVGGGSPETPDINELVLACSDGRCLARSWHGSQSRPFVVARACPRILAHVDVLCEVPEDALSRAADRGRELADMLSAFVGGATDVGVLWRGAPSLSWPS